MNSANVVLTILCAYNLTMMVINAYGDKFPQPGFRNRHANWLQGWKNTQNLTKRYWIGLVITFAVMMLFDFIGSIFAGFLVFLRLLVYIFGYRRVRSQIAQVAIAPPFTPETDSQQVVQAESLRNSVSAERAPVIQSASPQLPPSLEGKRSISKGVLAFLIVVAVCVAVTSSGYLYNRFHPLDNYVGSPPDNSPVGSDTTSALSGALGDSGGDANAPGGLTTSESAPQAAQVQQPVQASSQQATQQAVRQDTATEAQGGNSRVTVNTYGNVVASFYPGKSSLDAIGDALNAIHSELTVMDMSSTGYPDYQIECEANGRCVGGMGTPMGSVADIVKEMFPVNPADVGQNGITCGQYLCKDGQGSVIGRNPSMQ